MDDVLVHGPDQVTHDERLVKALEKIQSAGLTLNPDKCEFSKPKISYLGNLVEGNGIKPDPAKIEAIIKMQSPKDRTELRRFLGMTNQMGKFTPNLAEKTQPMRELLSTKSQWVWDVAQERSFLAVKKELSSTPTLALYSPDHETTISADASSYGLGAVLTQRQSDGSWRPVAYASRAMTDTEQRYAQVEKEALAVTWACEKFADYIIGMEFKLETDHKPLIPLLGSMSLASLPPRIQRFRMRLMRMTYRIVHVPGKDLTTADTLSRAPLTNRSSDEEIKKEEEVEAYVASVVRDLPATADRLNTLRVHQQQDGVTRQVMRYCADEWPEKARLDSVMKLYWAIRGELTVQRGLLMKGSRLVVPTSMRLDVLDRLHEGHQGITRCRERAKTSVWWPGLSKQLEELVRKCPVCAKERQNPVEPAIVSELPDRPWQKVAVDLFQLKGHPYLQVVDYFSRFPEVAKMSKGRTTASDVVNHLKSIFARHGIPEFVVSDNGPQFNAAEFRAFAEHYGFIHVTSSPKYPQSNGEVERTIQTVKNMLKKEEDPYKALIAYRSTPLASGYSPAELLMGRKIRSTVPSPPGQLDPKWSYLRKFREADKVLKAKQKRNFDVSHGARHIPELQTGDEVWIPDTKKSGIVKGKAHTPRSYLVQTPEGQLRRNRRDLNFIPKEQRVDRRKEDRIGTSREPPVQDDGTTQRKRSDRVTTRSGREIRLPKRYRE